MKEVTPLEAEEAPAAAEEKAAALAAALADLGLTCASRIELRLGRLEWRGHG